jgi:alkylation response protein AidB-like acyl-CoA dehydrogenase
MNFDADPTDEIFRTDLRQFLHVKLQELQPINHSDKSSMQRFSRALSSRGWLVPHWPKEWGGADWPPHWRRILEEEIWAARCPLTDGIGIDFVGPVLCAFGSPEQKRMYLPAIRSAEQFWCQGFSEPQAGSDVMSLRATARPERNSFIVNGHKLWTSNAHNADMMFALLRIETPGARRQPGLSFVLIDMRSPGITVRPLLLIDGVHRVNEVLLDNVKVPQANLVGEAGRGWVYARYLLANERTAIAGLGSVKLLLEDLKSVAAQMADGSMEAVYAPRIAQFEIELQALEYMQLRLLHSRSEESVVQVLAPILKMRACELRQRITELTLQLLAERGLELPFHQEANSEAALALMPPEPAATAATLNYLFQRSATLAGGTSEIQKNLIAGIALQL